MANKTLTLTEEQAKTLQTLLLLTVHRDGNEEGAAKERETLRSIYLMLVQDEARETFSRAAAEGDIVIGTNGSKHIAFLAESRARIDALKASIVEAHDAAQRTALQHELDRVIQEDRAAYDRLVAEAYPPALVVQ